MFYIVEKTVGEVRSSRSRQALKNFISNFKQETGLDWNWEFVTKEELDAAAERGGF